MVNDLKKTQVSFSIIILVLMAAMISGGFMLTNNYFFTTKYLKLNTDYLINEASMAGSSLKELTLASVLKVSGNENSSVGQPENSLSQSIPILLYHGVMEKSDGFNVLKTDFDEQMLALKKAGWQTISINDFDKFIKGEKQLPAKSFLLTFDDGRKDSFYPVDPVLRAIGYNAVIFIITGETQDRENKNYLSWPEIQYMAKSGRWEIQSHGNDDHGFITVDANGKKGYFLTNRMWLKDQQRIETEEEFEHRIINDLTTAKDTLNQKLKQNTIGFAFPMGDYGFQSVNIPQAQNVILPIVSKIYPVTFFQTWYGNAFSGNYPNVTQKSQQTLFRRIEAESSWKADDLLFVMEESLDKPLPFSDNFQTKNSWSVTWGVMERQNNFLKISANASTSGSVVFLDGSYLWQDYDFGAKVNPTPGNVFSLLSRYQDNESYLSCNFSPNRVTLQERINGQERKVAVWDLPKGEHLFASGQDINIGMQVVGQRARCLINGQVVLTSPGISPSLDHGGVGFRTWDEELGQAELTIKEVKVEELKGDSESITK